MRPLILFPYYVHWHFIEGPRNVVRITGNFVWFLWHFFSIGILMSTLFAPWQRLHEESQRKFDVEAILSTYVVNLIMRLVGVLVRSVFIIAGLIGIVMVVALGAVAFVFWLVMPLVILFSFVLGFVLLTQ